MNFSIYHSTVYCSAYHFFLDVTLIIGQSHSTPVAVNVCSGQRVNAQGSESNYEVYCCCPVFVFCCCSHLL
jgi:hypothetical protein